MSIIACSFNGCEKPSSAKGWCKGHYSQDRRGLALRPLGRTALSVEQRFMDKVAKTPTCWNWTGALYRNGYGAVRISGKTNGAHRYAYELANGPIPDGALIDHMCHNPPCVNPDHLRLATPKQNIENLSGPRSDSSTGIRGVYWSNTYSCYIASVGHHGRRYHVGRFADPKLAEQAVTAKRNELFTHNNLDR